MACAAMTTRANCISKANVAFFDALNLHDAEMVRVVGLLEGHVHDLVNEIIQRGTNDNSRI